MYIQNFNPEGIKVHRFKLSIRILQRRWKDLKPKFEVPLSNGNSESIPAEFLDSSLNVVHGKVLKLGKRGKGED